VDIPEKFEETEKTTSKSEQIGQKYKNLISHQKQRI